MNSRARAKNAKRGKLLITPKQNGAKPLSSKPCLIKTDALFIRP